MESREGGMERRELLQSLLLSSLGWATRKSQCQALPATPSLAAGDSRVPTGRQPRTSALTRLRMGEVVPAGCIREQMRRDLREGFAGKLDQLCPEAASDIFCTGRNQGSKANRQNAANVNWWNGETEGNWRAGYIGLACLSGDAAAMRKADAYVAHILSFQDEDGYLGVFGPEVRFTLPGELWTQACLFRALLDYAELKNRADVYAAVVRATDLTMSSLTRERMQSLSRVGSANAGGSGLSHDLMFADVCERLHQQTGDVRYIAFIVELYRALSDARPEADTALPALLKPNGSFKQHGVNTYESLRVPLWLAEVTQQQEYRLATRNGLLRMTRYTEPSGSAVSQESVLDLKPDPSTTFYEYCSTKEIQCTLQSALQKSGDARYGDGVEHIWFNAAQGSRLPDGKAISYLSQDNQLHFVRGGAGEGVSDRTKFRHKYSPTHADVAVCCNPNAAIVAPLYVRDMWMRTGSGGLGAMLYGPCTVETNVHGVKVRISEDTDYPFTEIVSITLHPATPVAFDLLLREPAWSGHTEVLCEGAHLTKGDGWLRLHKLWHASDMVRLRFERKVRTQTAVNEEVSLLYGPLLFALPVEGTKHTERTYPLPGFEDATWNPPAEPATLSLLQTDVGFGFKPGPGHPDSVSQRPFDVPALTLRGTMSDSRGPATDVELVPLGNAPTLRRTTFPVSATAPSRTGAPSS